MEDKCMKLVFGHILILFSARYFLNIYYFKTKVFESTTVNY